MKTIYDLITEDESLTLEQFVQMCMSKPCNEILSKMMGVVHNYRNDWKTQEACKAIGVTKYLPFSFERMIKNLAYRQERASLVEQFEKEKDETVKMKVLLQIMDEDSSKCKESIKPTFMYKIEKQNLKKKEIKKKLGGKVGYLKSNSIKPGMDQPEYEIQ